MALQVAFELLSFIELLAAVTLVVRWQSIGMRLLQLVKALSALQKNSQSRRKKIRSHRIGTERTVNLHWTATLPSVSTETSLVRSFGSRCRVVSGCGDVCGGGERSAEAAAAAIVVLWCTDLTAVELAKQVSRRRRHSPVNQSHQRCLHARRGDR